MQTSKVIPFYPEGDAPIFGGSRQSTRHEITEAVAIASQYRTGLDPHLQNRGVVTVHNGVAQGWQNELRDPHNWVPGVIAVPANGPCHRATGGNEQTGAHTWEPIASEITDWIFPGKVIPLNEHINMGIAYDQIDGEYLPRLKFWHQGSRIKDCYFKGNQVDLRTSCQIIITQLATQTTPTGRPMKTLIVIEKTPYSWQK